tara:strand:+ start:12489 stop:13661 length:1173 start_codon:yes stop_codon:yes gene_type:complete
MVPNGWEQKAFGEVVKLSKSKYDPKKSTDCFPCIELEHIVQETGQLTGNVPASNLGSTKNKFKAGDVIFGKLRPYLRKYAQPNFDGVCSSEIWVFSATKKIINPYLFQLVQTNQFISEANKSAGSKMPRADWGVVSEMIFPLPPLPEQRKIANILSTWDKAISTTECLITNSKQQKKALMQQLLTGKKRFAGFTKDWKQIHLGDIGKCITGLTYKPSDTVDDGMLVLRSSNIQDSKLAFEDNVFVNVDLKVKSKTQENDILVCVRNGSKNLIGKSTLIKGRAIGQAHGAFMTLFRGKYPLYVSQLFQSNEFFRQVNMNLGATINSINTSDLHKFKFSIPTDENEINAIAACLSNAEKEIEVLQQQLADLKLEKKALMQQLLTGKRRVTLN